MTWLTVKPYFRQWAPPAFSATLPPIEQTSCEDGSGAYASPCGVASRVTHRLMTPGSTTIRALSASTGSMRRSRDSTSSTPSAEGRAPPDSPVPEPRATKGTPASAHSRTVSTTCCRLSASTTTAGVTRKLARPSHS